MTLIRRKYQMRNSVDQLFTNQNLTINDIDLFFESKPTAENIAHFFSPGFPSALLEADHFINLLKRRALRDETGACRIIDYAAPHLPAIIRDTRAFKLFFQALSKNVLTHLFSKADFIPKRFLNNIATTSHWLRDNNYSSDHRVFLFKYYQQHLIHSIQSQPFTPGILSALLQFFVTLDERHSAFTTEIVQLIKPSIINLLCTPHLLPALRYILLSALTANEFTFLIREIPESFGLLSNIENPKYFPPILFEKLPPEQSAFIQMQLIQNLIAYYEQQKGCPAFFTPTHHPEDSHFISAIKNIVNQSEKEPMKKITEIQKNIDAQHESLSTYIKKLLEERQFRTSVCNPSTFTSEKRASIKV